MVDLRRARRRRPPRRAAICGTCWITAAIAVGPCARVAFQFGSGPAHHLGDRLPALRALGDHLGHDRLDVHLLRDAGGRRREGHPGHLVLARRVVIHGTFGRLDLLPDLEIPHALERRDVVTDARINQLLDVLALQEMREQALARRLVLGEAPQRPQEGQERRIAPLRALGHLDGVQLLADLGIVALRDRVGRGRVHDQRALAGDDVLVVGGIVPGEDIRRHDLHQPLRVLEHVLHRVGLDGNVPLGIDQVRAKGSEQRSHPVDRVRGFTESEADRIAGLLQFLGGAQQRVPGPVVRLLGGRLVDGVHRLDVDSGVLLEKIQAHAGRLDLRPGHSRHRDPVAVLFRQEFGCRRDRAVFLDQRAHHIVERLKLLGVGESVPGRMREDVVPRFRLRLGDDRQHVLVALRRDVVDLHVHFFLRAPIHAQLGERVVRPRHPMVPEADRKRARGVRGTDVRCCDGGGRSGSSGLQEAPAIERDGHREFPPQGDGRTASFDNARTGEIPQ